MSKRKIRGLIILVTLTGASAAASAQDPRLGNKLDAPTKAAVAAIVDSARAQGLPYEALNEKMYEGQGKGAEGPMIVAAVRQLSLELAIARRTLGSAATPDELKAAASAMHAGVSPVELGKIKRYSRLHSLALPLTVLGDIISRGVPVGAAANAVRSLVGAGAKDKEINDFQRNVKTDIEQGAPPAAAAETRAKAPASPAKPDTKPESQNEDKIER